MGDRDINIIKLGRLAVENPLRELQDHYEKSGSTHMSHCDPTKREMASPYCKRRQVNVPKTDSTQLHVVDHCGPVQEDIDLLYT